MKKISHPFVPFEADSSVCDDCGKLADQHLTAVMFEYREKVWEFLLKRGYIHNYYGGHRDWEMEQIASHMAGCSVNWDYTEDPKAGTLEEFTDSFNPSATVEKFFGVLYCKCGEISYKEVCIDDMTLGQIIWHIAKGK